jgi:hypothetical protein
VYSKAGCDVNALCVRFGFDFVLSPALFHTVFLFTFLFF